MAEDEQNATEAKQQDMHQGQQEQHGGSG